MGIAIGVAIVVVVAVLVGLARRPAGGAFGSDARFPPGTKAFESEMTLGILARMIALRENELASGTAEPKRALLEKQIANMRKQTALHRAVVDRADTSPGKMSIGVNPDADHID